MLLASSRKSSLATPRHHSPVDPTGSSSKVGETDCCFRPFTSLGTVPHLPLPVTHSGRLSPPWVRPPTIACQLAPWTSTTSSEGDMLTAFMGCAVSCLPCFQDMAAGSLPDIEDVAHGSTRHQGPLPFHLANSRPSGPPGRSTHGGCAYVSPSAGPMDTSHSAFHLSHPVFSPEWPCAGQV